MRYSMFAIASIFLLAGASCGPGEPNQNVNQNQNTNQNDNATQNSNDNEGGGNSNDNAVNQPPTIMGTSPAMDLTVALGQSFLVRWEDEDPDDDAAITVALQPTQGGDPIVVSTGLTEDPELNTTLASTGGLAAGDYFILLTIDDGTNEPVTAFHEIEGSGERVVITTDEPLAVTEPTQDAAIDQGAGVLVRWNDGDPDDETIVISIELRPVDGGSAVVVRDNLAADGTLNTFLVDTSSVAPGVYFIAVSITRDEAFTAFALREGTQDRVEVTISEP